MIPAERSGSRASSKVPEGISKHVSKGGLHFAKNGVTDIDRRNGDDIKIDQVVKIDRTTPERGITGLFDGQQNGIEA